MQSMIPIRDQSYKYQFRDLIDANPCVDFDFWTALIYPLLDQIYSSGDRLSLVLGNGLRLGCFCKSNISQEIFLR
jgi:hypothetical protein